MNAAADYDLLVKGGRVVDPLAGIDDKRDVAVSGNRIVGVERDIPATGTRRLISAEGKIVVPGLIDLHCHVFHMGTGNGLAPDDVGIRSGVTTVADAGSSGANNFAAFRRLCIDASATDVYAWLNLSSIGMVCGPLVGELKDMRLIEPEAMKGIVQANRDRIVGIKLRAISSCMGENGIHPIIKAKEIGRELGIPLLVHIGEGNPDAQGNVVDIEAVLSILEEGDVLSHLYTANPGGVLRSGGTVAPALLSAMQRGVILDGGRGRKNLSFDMVRRLRAEGISADAISTDLTLHTRKGPVYDLLTTMSEFLALGFSLHEVVERTTVGPAKALRMDHEIGSLKAGYRADISILKEVEGPWENRDAEGVVLTANRGLEPVLTIKDGKLYEPLLIERPYR
jgi:dihydroorotase